MTTTIRPRLTSTKPPRRQSFTKKELDSATFESDELLLNPNSYSAEPMILLLFLGSRWTRARPKKKKKLLLSISSSVYLQCTAAAIILKVNKEEIRVGAEIPQADILVLCRIPQAVSDSFVDTFAQPSLEALSNVFCYAWDCFATCVIY